MQKCNFLGGRFAEGRGRICGASKVHIVHAHARSAHHLQAAARSFEDFLRHLRGSSPMSYSCQFHQLWAHLTDYSLSMPSAARERCHSKSCCAGQACF